MLYRSEYAGDEKLCSTPDEVLEYSIDEVSLRKIITKVDVQYRTI